MRILNDAAIKPHVLLLPHNLDYMMWCVCATPSIKLIYNEEGDDKREEIELEALNDCEMRAPSTVMNRTYLASLSYL